MGFLKGALSATLRFDLYEESFAFKVVEPGQIHKLALEIDEELDAFVAQDFILQEGDIAVIKKDLDLSLALNKGDSQLNIQARTRNGKFEMEVPNSFLDLKDFSPVLGYELKGKGLFDSQ